MANPFNSPSLSGFNDSPPADDGSQVASNEIEWQKHLDKIGTPLKNYVDALKSNTSAAFGKIAGNSVTSISSNYTVQASDQGKLLVCENTITVTLLSATTASTNFMLMILNDGSGNVTVDGDGSETINGSTTITLLSEESAILVSDGSNWSAIVVQNRSETATFAPSWVGFSSDPSEDVSYTKAGNIITLQIHDASTAHGTSNANNFGWNAGTVPEAARPGIQKNCLCLLRDNGSHVTGMVSISSGGAATFYPNQTPTGSTSWTTSGQKGLGVGWNITYSVD